MSQSLLALLLVVIAFASSWAQTGVLAAPEGRITGTVLTEDGQLASGAKACTSVHSGNNTSITCMAVVDAEGRFTIDHLKQGTYEVFATNEAEGYSIQNQIPGHKIAITSANLSPDIIVQLTQEEPS